MRLDAFLTPTIYEDERSALRSGFISPRERTPDTHQIGRSGEKNLCASWESNTCRPGSDHSLQ